MTTTKKRQPINSETVKQAVLGMGADGGFLAGCTDAQWRLARYGILTALGQKPTDRTYEDVDRLMCGLVREAMRGSPLPQD